MGRQSRSASKHRAVLALHEQTQGTVGVHIHIHVYGQ